MAFKLKSKTTAVAGGAIAASSVAVAANLAQIAEFFRNVRGEDVLEVSRMMLDNPFVWGGTLSFASLGIGAATGVLIHRRRGRSREYQMEELRHAFQDHMRTEMAQLCNQLANDSMTSQRLCNLFAVAIRDNLEALEAYFTLKEGRQCRVSLYVIDEDDSLHPRGNHSRAGERERRNLRNSEIRFDTAMRRIIRMDPNKTPIVRVEDIRRTESDWHDAETDQHEKLYNSCLHVGIQYRPDHNFIHGKFGKVDPGKRILAGFLVIECEGKSFRSPNVEDAAAAYADRLFSALVEVSRASEQLGGDFGWVYRSLIGKKRDKDSGEDN